MSEIRLPYRYQPLKDSKVPTTYLWSHDITSVSASFNHPTSDHTELILSGTPTATELATVNVLVDGTDNFSTNLRILMPQTYTRSLHYPESYWAMSIEFGEAQTQWMHSHDAAVPLLPVPAQPGSIKVIPPEGFVLPGQSINIENYTSPAPRATYKLTDIGGAVSDIIANKYVNGFGTKNRVLRVYNWPRYRDLDENQDIRATHFIENRQTGLGTKTIQCVDIKRKSKTKVFNPITWRLVETIDVDEVDGIKIYGPEPIYFQHDKNYDLNPGELIAYLFTPEIDERREIISFTGHIDLGGDIWELTGVTRNAFNSTSVILRVDSGQKIENGPSMTEYVYYEEFTQSFIRGIHGGSTYDDRVLPPHWRVSDEDQWIDDYSLQYTPDINLFRWTLKNYGEVEAKKLIETEVLQFINSAMLVNEFGRLQLVRVSDVAADNPGYARFDNSNVDPETVGNLVTKTSTIASAIQLFYGYDSFEDAYAFNQTFIDPSSNSTNPGGEPYVMESKLIQPSIHTTTQIRQLIGATGNLKFHEVVEITFTGKPSTGSVRVGDIVQVDFRDLLRDDSTDNPTWVGLNRAMVVTSKSPGANNGWTFSCYGTRRRASIAQSSQLLRHISDVNYSRNAVDLKTLGNWDIDAGVYTLQSDLSISLNVKYKFMDNPCVIPAARTLTGSDFGPMVQIWANVSLSMLGTIDTSGQGHHEGGAAGELGDYGYALPPRVGGGVDVIPEVERDGSDYNEISATFTSTPGPEYVNHSAGDIPEEALSNNDDVFAGYPTDLAGYGGIGAPSVTGEYYPGANPIAVDLPGDPGRRSAAGIMIVTPDLIVAPTTLFRMNGEDAPDPELVVVPGLGHIIKNVYFSAGSGGGNGSLRIYIDSGATFLFDNVLPNYVEAYQGESPIFGARLGSEREEFYNPSTGVHSFYEPSPRVNLARAASRMVRIPAPEVVQDAPPLSSIDQAFINQRDNLIVLIPTSTTAPPANGNPGDMAISQALLDSNVEDPYAIIMGNDYKWTAIDWDNISQAYRTLLYVNREFGGTQFFNQFGRPTTYKDGDAWKDKATGLTWILHFPPERDELLYDYNTLIGEELLRDPNFALTADGQQVYTFTTDMELEPLNVFQQVVDAIARAFINVTSVTGDFKIKDGGDPLPTTLLPPTDLNAFAVDAITINVTWTLPPDITNIDGYEIELNGVPKTPSGPTGTSTGFSGLTPDTAYTVTMRSYNNEGDLSVTVSDTATTPASGPGRTITINTTGRLVSGTSTGFDTGRQMSLKLDDDSEFFDNVDSNGDWSFDVPSGYDNNGGKQASLYINNGDSSTELNPKFTYTTN